MKPFQLNRIVSFVLASMLVFWTAFPAVSFAFTPGKPISPGKAIKPGDPISGGSFIAPGEVYDPGNPFQLGDGYTPGQTWNSGKPIIELYFINKGTFIIPNVPPPPPNVSFDGQNITTGGPLNAGDASSPGESVNGGEVANGGTAVNGGSANGSGTSITGGEVTSGGQASNNGSSIDGGSASGKGDPLKGGNPSSGGQAPNGGSGINGGNAGDGQTLDGGQFPSQTDGFQGGQAANGNSVQSGSDSIDGKSNGNTNDSLLAGVLGTGLTWIKDVKRWGTDMIFAADDIVQGVIAHKAGYKFVQDGKNNYKLLGDRDTNNKVTQWFLDRYSKDINPGKRNFNKFKMEEFLDGKKLNGFTANLKKVYEINGFNLIKKQKKFRKKVGKKQSAFQNGHLTKMY